MVEVLIAGAGPAGSAAAIRLARLGHEVLLVDRCRFPRLKPCGEYYNPECCRLLAELGVLPAIQAAGARPVSALAFGTPEGSGLAVPFEGLAGSALSLGRETLDTLLVQAARDAGVTVWEGATVREPLTDHNGSVQGARIRVEGRDREVLARVTLAADGIRSRIARCLGLGAGDGGRRKLGIAARCDAAEGAPERVEMHAGGPGCCGLVVRGQEANLGLVADVGQAREIGGDPAGFVSRTLDAFPRLRPWVRGEPHSVRTIGPLTWITRRQAVAGCLLLGDAAGFYDPFTGQGVTFALMTAELAAAIAHAGLEEDDLSADRLQEYARERRVLLGPKIQVQKAIQWVMEHPRVRERVLTRLNLRPALARDLVGVLADVLPAERAFSPGFLARLVA